MNTKARTPDELIADRLVQAILQRREAQRAVEFAEQEMYDADRACGAKGGSMRYRLMKMVSAKLAKHDGR